MEKFNLQSQESTAEFNPAGVSPKHGIKVLQTWRTLQKVTITATVSDGNGSNENTYFPKMNAINAVESKSIDQDLCPILYW